MDSIPPSRFLTGYRGRIAPSPTGYLHLGHARTFWIAQERARRFGGTLILRNEDLDDARCRPRFNEAILEDLRWFGFVWQEGPDVGGPLGPYRQSERHSHYRDAFTALREQGFIYPCVCSRRDVREALGAPHGPDDDPVYPGTCRPGPGHQEVGPAQHRNPALSTERARGRQVSWRFAVPPGESVSFDDGGAGRQTFIAGKDFGDFIVWRHDDRPSYELAVVVDDALMQITEVVRGADLLLSTARQILLYRVLGFRPPAFFHCPLMLDDQGARLAKRHDALSLRTLKAEGANSGDLRLGWEELASGVLSEPPRRGSMES